MPRTFSTGIEVPTATDQHPSEQWWSRVGATTNAAILRVSAEDQAKAQAALASLRADTVSRSEASQYGIPGPPNRLGVGTVQGGVAAAVSITGTAPQQTVHFTLPQGPRGPEGPGGAFQMRETADVGMYEVSDVSNAAVQAAAEAALKRLVVDIAPRNLTASLPNVTSGTVSIARYGPIVTLRFNDLVVAPSEANTYSTFRSLIPSGFRPPSGYVYFATPSRTTSSSVGTARIDNFGHLTIYDHKATDNIRGVWTWRTPDAAPTTLPGTAM